MSVFRASIDLPLAIMLLVLVPLLSVFGIGGLSVFVALENRLEARLQEDIAIIARTLKQPMAEALDRDRSRAMQQALSSAYEFGRVYGVYVYDEGGELVTSADRLGSNTHLRAEDADIRELVREDEIGDYRSIGGQEVFSYFTPLMGTGGQVIGMLQITRQVSEMRDYINSMRWQAFLILLAFSAVLVGIVIAGHQAAIGRPLSLLTQAMDEVSAGNKDTRVSPQGPKEMQQLGRRFNLMLDGIRDRDRRLHEQNQEHVELAERLRETEKYALAGRLAAGVAHELGTPLSVVDGYVQRLLRGHQDGAAARKALLGVRAATQRMAEVIQHLLGLGRASSMPGTRISVARLIRLAAADVQSRFASDGTTLDCPGNSPDALVAGDEGRLREALTHLLRNAMHAAHGGLVRLRWQPTGDSVEIIVEDSGTGIADEDRERIFEPFYTTKKAGEGSGLGLAVVRGIVTAHDSSISVTESALGGAAFRILLPMAGPR